MNVDIQFDTSDRSVVAVCTCGAREVFWDSAPAYDWAQAHLRIAHPNEVVVLVAQRIRSARYRYR